jgi:hypothetical protein
LSLSIAPARAGESAGGAPGSMDAVGVVDSVSLMDQQLQRSLLKYENTRITA